MTHDDRLFPAGDAAPACPGPGTPAGQIYWEEGRRHVGVAVLRLLREADPSHLPRLFLTQEEDDARNRSDL